MKIIENLSDIGSLPFPVATTGTFDGVHIGHQKILSDVSVQAIARGGSSVVITYWPHPRFVVGKNGNGLKLLTTFDEKAAFIASCGIDYLVKLRFTRKFSEYSSEAYIQKILIEGVGVRKLVIGYDHKFGKDREGGFDYLVANQDRLGFEVQEIPRQDIDHVGVSSTKIRNALNSGDVQTAMEYLGRPYSLSGIVTKGEQLGRKIGFPTANIYVPEDYKLIPSDGVYAVMVCLEGQEYQGMLNIGMRPTVDGHDRTIEVNIFNFERDIYGLRLGIKFMAQLRKEQKFPGVDELKQQLERDKAQARLFFENKQ